MRIGIDAQITKSKMTGIGFYTDNLIRALQKIDVQDQIIPYKSTQKGDLSTPQRIWWDQIQLPSLIRKTKADIFHQTGFSAPIMHPCKTVVTVHDVSSLFIKDKSLISHSYFAKWVPFTYRFADHIIAVSHHTKKDIVKYLKINPEKITVIHEAADRSFSAPVTSEKLSAVYTKYKIPHTEYILHIGTLNPRKNLEFLIQVFAEFKKQSGLPHKLAIAGRKGLYYERLFALVKDLKLGDEVVFLGYVDDADKSALYHGADLLAFPSEYEGFGLPPLEAMICGTPVISSNTSSLPEVIGEEGIGLDPHDKTAWVHMIAKALTDKSFRSKMIESGKLQAAKFSWEKCAKETLAVYQNVLSR